MRRNLIFTLMSLCLAIRRTLRLLGRVLKALKPVIIFGLSLLLCLSAALQPSYAYSESGFNAYIEDTIYKNDVGFQVLYNQAIQLTSVSTAPNVAIFKGTLISGNYEGISCYILISSSSTRFVHVYSNYQVQFRSSSTNGSATTNYIHAVSIDGIDTFLESSSFNSNIKISADTLTYYCNKSFSIGSQTAIQPVRVVEKFQVTPTPTPTPEPTPEPTPTPVPTSTPLPTQTPLPTATPMPSQIPGLEYQLQYLYLSDFNLIRANRFFLSYGFTDNRLDVWQNFYEEASHGFSNGTVSIGAISQGTTYENLSLSEATRIWQTNAAIQEVTGTLGYFINLDDMQYACEVTAASGTAAPDMWECHPESAGGHSDIYVFIDTLQHSQEATGAPPVYWNIYTVGGDTYSGSAAAAGSLIGTINETTNSSGETVNNFQWTTTSFLNVQHNTRIYANVLYTPDNLIPLNGLADFGEGNYFQMYSKTQTFQEDNPPCFIYLVYDGTYNASIFTDGAMSWTPWKLVNGQKVYTGNITKTAKISGGGIVECCVFSGFTDGDIVGADLTINSGIGSVQPLFIGNFEAIPNEVYAVLTGITQGAKQTQEIIASVEDLKNDLADTSNASDLEQDLGEMISDLSEHGYSYPIEALQNMKSSLQGVTEMKYIRLPALFATDKYYEIRLDIIETELPALFIFFRGLINMAAAISLYNMVVNFIKTFFGFKGDETDDDS